MYTLILLAATALPPQATNAEDVKASLLLHASTESKKVVNTEKACSVGCECGCVEGSSCSCNAEKTTSKRSTASSSNDSTKATAEGWTYDPVRKVHWRWAKPEEVIKPLVGTVTATRCESCEGGTCFPAYTLPPRIPSETPILRTVYPMYTMPTYVPQTYIQPSFSFAPACVGGG